MEVSEIRDTIKELERAADVERQLQVLQKLDKDFAPTEPLLRETRLGVAVNKLRTHSDTRVAELVKKMIGRWKEQVQGQKHAQTKAKAKVAQAAKPKEGEKIGSNGATKTANVKPEANGGPRTAKLDGAVTNIYDDKVRNSCVELIYNALVLDTGESTAKTLAVAKTIEAAEYKSEKGVGGNYRTKMRSLYMNLKDPKNPGLRARMLSGEITAERLIKMTPQEMASEELKKEIEAIGKQNLFNAQGATEKRAVTDRFTCGKCKQKKVSYYQMQTRSADEPLTTFCTCEVCGNRWKFS